MHCFLFSSGSLASSPPSLYRALLLSTSQGCKAQSSCGLVPDLQSIFCSLKPAQIFEGWGAEPNLASPQILALPPPFFSLRLSRRM